MASCHKWRWVLLVALLAGLPTLWVLDARGQSGAMTQLQGIGTINSEITLHDANGVNNDVQVTEAYALEFNDTGGLKVSATGISNTGKIQFNAHFYISSGTRNIWYSDDTTHFPLNATELYLGEEVNNTSVQITVHEMNVIGFPHDAQFNYTSQETASSGASGQILKVFSTSGVYYCHT